jgi:hypothetical protein
MAVTVRKVYFYQLKQKQKYVHDPKIENRVERLLGLGHRGGNFKVQHRTDESNKKKLFQAYLSLGRFASFNSTKDGFNGFF